MVIRLQFERCCLPALIRRIQTHGPRQLDESSFVPGFIIESTGQGYKRLLRRKYAKMNPFNNHSNSAHQIKSTRQLLCSQEISHRGVMMVREENPLW